MKRMTLCAAAIGSLAAAAGATEIYAVNHLAFYPDNGPDALIRFDSANPAGFVTVGSMGVENTGFGGLDFDRSGNLWAYATFNKTTGGARAGLYSVDPATGVATVQGSLSSQTLTDLAFNPVTNTMYGVFSQGFSNSRLYSINLQTGAVTVVGAITGLMPQHNLVGLAFDSGGTLFAYDNYNNTIYRADASLHVTALYTSTLVAVGSQGITIDWSHDNLGYHGAIGQGEFPNYYNNLNTFATDGSSYIWGPDFGPNRPDGIPLVQPGDLAIRPGGGATCYANCDGSSVPPILNVNDFVCFQAAFASGASYANCDGSTSTPILNVNDFVCFQSKFAAGCP